MGGVLNSSIVEEEVNGNDLPNTPLEEKLLALTKKNKELQEKVASAEGQFEEMLEKNDEMTMKNLELQQKVASTEGQLEELFKKNREATKTNQVSTFIYRLYYALQDITLLNLYDRTLPGGWTVSKV